MLPGFADANALSKMGGATTDGGRTDSQPFADELHDTITRAVAPSDADFRAATPP